MTREHGPGQGTLRRFGSQPRAPLIPCTRCRASLCVGAGTLPTALPFPSALTDAFAAALTRQGLEQLRSRAEPGRRVPVPLRKHETIKEEQGSLLLSSRSAKRRRNAAELRAAPPGQLSCPLARGELQKPLPRPWQGTRQQGGCQGAWPKGCPDPALLLVGIPSAGSHVWAGAVVLRRGGALGKG